MTVTNREMRVERNTAISENRKRNYADNLKLKHLICRKITQYSYSIQGMSEVSSSYMKVNIFYLLLLAPNIILTSCFKGNA